MYASRGIRRALKRLVTRFIGEPFKQKTLLPAEVDTADIRRIIFFCQHDTLPEIFLSLQIFSGTRNAFPDAEIVVVADRRTAPILRHNPDVDVTVRHYGLLVNWPLTEAFGFARVLLGGCDLCVVLQTEGLHTPFHLLVACARAGYVLGSEQAAFSGFVAGMLYNLVAPFHLTSHHRLKQRRDITRHLGIKTDGAGAGLLFETSEQSDALNLLFENGVDSKQFILYISAEYRVPESEWLHECFLGVAKHFALSRDAAVVISSPAADTERQRHLIDSVAGIQLNSSDLGLRRQAIVMHLSSLILTCSLDSMYLGAAVGTPTLGLCDSIDMQEWLPPTPAFLSISGRQGEVSRMSVEQVIQATEGLLLQRALAGSFFDITEKALDDYLDFGDIDDSI